MTSATVPVVLVGGGKGGVGKSSVTAGLARLLRKRGHRVGVLDADLSGPSQGLLLHCSEMQGADGEIVPALSAEGIGVVSTGLIARTNSALVWSGPTASAAIESFASSAVWSASDVVIVDLPPGHAEIAIKVATTFPQAHGFLVTTGSALAIGECRRAATFMQRMEITIAGLVENMAQTYCNTCSTYQEVFPGRKAQALADEIGVPLLARIVFGMDPAAGEAVEPMADAVVTAFNLPTNTEHAPTLNR